jgi:eukaryotic-like serine/threonine-protein kinase
VATTTLGPYRMLSELGSGGMGTVYLAIVEGDVEGIARGERVALKVLHAHLVKETQFVRRFVREGQIGRAVRHPNVARTYDAGEAESGGVRRPYIALEYIEGRTLRSMIKEVGALPDEICRHVGLEIANALAAIHAAGAVHRDVKPENVIVTPDHRVKLTDLGVARLADAAQRLSQSGAFLGSILYAAPEQLRGERDLDGRADLYALGLVLFELATGRHAFHSEDVPTLLQQQMNVLPDPPSLLNPGISAFLDGVVLRLCRKHADERFSSAAEVAHVLATGEGAPALAAPAPATLRGLWERASLAAARGRSKSGG